MWDDKFGAAAPAPADQRADLAHAHARYDWPARPAGLLERARVCKTPDFEYDEY